MRVPHVRATNRATVLQLLRRYKYLSRAELARRTGLSEAAVSRIVARLLHEGLVVAEGGEEATGGRPAIRLQLNEARFQAVGVDIQNWETRISLGTITGRILATRRFRTPPSPEKALKLISEQVEELSASPADGFPEAVGVAVRGLVNSETGVAELGNDPSWVRVGVKQLLSELLGRPVYVENNVRAAAQAEHDYGLTEMQNSRCLLFVKVDEGVGMGIILDGKLYRGPRMAAGELGQMVISDSEGTMRHDRPGCLEMLASDLAIIARYNRLANEEIRSGSVSTAEQVRRICHLALEGDAAARETILETARYLGIGIANAVWALDAEMVVLDGAITDAWPLVLPAMRAQFPESSEFLNFYNLIVRPSSLQGEASIIGACTLPFSCLFSAE
jgi:predicted NBD/HSP70 family sugar kinase